MTTSESLPTTYRPRTFTTVVGQDSVVTAIRSMISRGTLPQQILLSGPSGTGKTTLARLIAAATLCETPMADRVDADPCQTCETCVDILTPGHNHPDVMEIDAASHGRVDEIRELAGNVQFTPVRASRRVVIVDEAHGLTGAGGNAFLKLLEEPPSHVLFLLATTDPEKMLVTNRSRVTELPLARPSSASLQANLQRVAAGQCWALSPDLAAAVVDATDSSLGVRGTLMTLQKIAALLDPDNPEGPAAAMELLGAASPMLVSDLRSAYLSGDSARTLEACREISARSSATAIYRALLQASMADLEKASAAGGSALSAAICQHDLLAAAAGDRKPLETTLLRLAMQHAPSTERVPAPSPTPQQDPAPQPDPVSRYLQALAEASPATAELVRSLAHLTPGEGSQIVVESTADGLNTLRNGPAGEPMARVARQLGVTLSPKLGRH